MIKNLYAFAAIFISSVCFADQIVDQGAGYVGRGYFQGSFLGTVHLPSATLWRKDLDGKQEIIFSFSSKTAGKKPESFQNSSSSQRLNGFYFKAPIATEFHFEGISFDSNSCSKTPSGKIKIYKDIDLTINEGESFFLQGGESIYLKFDIEGWENCSFEKLTFRYFLTGSFSLEDYPSRVGKPGKDEKSFNIEVKTPAIYSPIFRYSVKNVSFPSLEKTFEQCQMKPIVRTPSTSSLSPEELNTALTVTCPPSVGLSWWKQSWLIENADSIRFTFQDVIAQVKMPYTPEFGSKYWYIDPNVPIYHYRTVDATGLILSR